MMMERTDMDTEVSRKSSSCMYWEWELPGSSSRPRSSNATAQQAASSGPLLECSVAKCAHVCTLPCAVVSNIRHIGQNCGY